MTLADFLALEHDAETIKALPGRQVNFVHASGNIKTARLESINLNGTATIRYNGRSEADWYLPFALPWAQITLDLQADGLPLPYDARPLTQR